MATTHRTFRIFVSSTFSDLKAERNALQARVFPRLRDLAAAHGCRFQVIDLRWGVSEEASLDQQAMNICLGEVARCQQISPRPNFIVLLGDRYGWMPPPALVPDDEFRQILELVAVEDRALLEAWYTLDENAVPPEWRLQPREKGGPYEQYGAWQPVEARLQRILAAAAVELGFAGERLLTYTASATEQEIAVGALRVEDAPEHVMSFFRRIDGLPEKFDIATRDFLDLDEQQGAVDAEAHARQEALKERLARHVPGNVCRYQARWTGSGITTDHIDQLCQDVYESLERIILAEIEQPHEVAWTEARPAHIRPDRALDDEGRAHWEFAQERLRFFVGRAEVLAEIAAHLQEGGRRTLAIVGAGGTGKSALLAKAVEQAQERHPGVQAVYRFIGATPGSSGGRDLLESLCREISRRYGANESIPLGYQDLVPELGKRMALAGADKPLVLFLDSLDQLSAGQGARGLTWLPARLPEHVSVVVSTRAEEDIAPVLEEKQARQVQLGGLEPQEGAALLSQWLESVGRTLQDAQRAEVLHKFEQSEGNPLYLKLAFEEARLWMSYQRQEELAIGLEGIIWENMLGRLKDEGKHGEMLVSRALGYLAASRHGLAEDELVDLLSRDLEVYAWFFKQTYHLPSDLVQRAAEYRHSHSRAYAQEDVESNEEAAALAWLNKLKQLERGPGIPEPVTRLLERVLPKADGPRLPVVLWSRLSFDLAPYVAERLVDGIALLNFYHRELKDVSETAFLAGEPARAHHEKLADYFGGRRMLDRRRIDEEPWQLAKAELWERLFILLSDYEFTKILWEQTPFDLLFYWTQLEKNSPYRVVAGYQDLVAHPQAYSAYTVLTVVRLLNELGHLADNMSLVEYLVQYYQEKKDTYNLQIVLGYKAAILQVSSQLDDALELYETQERISRESGDRYGLSQAIGNRAVILQMQGRLDEAMDLLKEQEHLCVQGNNRQGLATCLGNQALVLKTRGQLQAAMELHKEEERIFRELGDYRGVSSSLLNQATILLARGEANKALDVLGQSEEIARQYGYLNIIQKVVGNRAEILIKLGQFEEAMRLAQEQERICRELDNSYDLISSLGNQAVICLHRGELEEAMDRFTETEKLCRQVGNLRGLALTLNNQAAILDSQGRVDQVMALYEEMEDICRQTGQIESLVMCIANQAITKYRHKLADIETIRRQLYEAIELASSHGYRELERQTREVYASISGSG